MGELRLDSIERYDVIRAIRDYFAVAVLMRASGQVALAKTVLDSATANLLNAETNGVSIDNYLL